MGLGLIIGAIAVGAALCAHSSSSQSSSNVTYTSAPSRPVYNVIYQDRTVSHQQKVSFFDTYRSLDNYLARLIGEGSGGIGLLIYTCKHLNVQIDALNRLIPGLRQARDYRNNLAHNKNCWSQIPDPDIDLRHLLDRVRSIVCSNSSYISKMMYRELANMKARRR